MAPGALILTSNLIRFFSRFLPLLDPPGVELSVPTGALFFNNEPK